MASVWQQRAFWIAKLLINELNLDKQIYAERRK